MEDSKIKKLIVILFVVFLIVLGFSIKVSFFSNTDKFNGVKEFETVLMKNEVVLDHQKEILKRNDELISDKKILTMKKEELINISQKDQEILKQNEKIIDNLEQTYYVSAIIMSKKMNNIASAEKRLNEYKSILNSNKYVTNFDAKLLKLNNQLKEVSE